LFSKQSAGFWKNIGGQRHAHAAEETDEVGTAVEVSFELAEPLPLAAAAAGRIFKALQFSLAQCGHDSLRGGDEGGE
jgi:hypothetical protein